MIQELATAIKNKHVILFVGSGVPKNLGLPVYSELMNQMAIILDMIQSNSKHGAIMIF